MALLLVSMLLVRQLLQNKQLIPLERIAGANARTYSEILQPFVKEEVDVYRASLGFSYNNAETIYTQSCAFCHGKDADGNGVEAKTLWCRLKTSLP
jgi:cytochrome c